MPNGGERFDLAAAGTVAEGTLPDRKHRARGDHRRRFHREPSATRRSPTLRSNSNFADDGVTPASRSRDGRTPTFGANDEWFFSRERFRLVRTGAEMQLAATDGIDYTYRGISLSTAADVPVFRPPAWTVDAGRGYRDYYGASITPSRNQHVLRAASPLRWRRTDHPSTSAVFNFDDIPLDERSVFGVALRDGPHDGNTLLARRAACRGRRRFRAAAPPF